MTTSEERKALNEGTFRDANARLEQGARELVADGDESLVPFLCECPKTDCTQVVLVTLAEYDALRSHERRGLAALGHEDLSVERVVDQNDRFTVTEKFGRAGEVHTETDRRE